MLKSCYLGTRRYQGGIAISFFLYPNGLLSKKPLSTDGLFRLCRWTIKSIKYCCYFLCVCLHFAGRRISHFTEDFSKTLPSFWQSKKSPVLSREKGRYYRLSAERRWTPWHLIAGNLKSNVRYFTSLIFSLIRFLTNAAISCVFKEPYSSNKIGFK